MARHESRAGRTCCASRHDGDGEVEAHQPYAPESHQGGGQAAKQRVRFFVHAPVRAEPRQPRAGCRTRSAPGGCGRGRAGWPVRQQAHEPEQQRHGWRKSRRRTRPIPAGCGNSAARPCCWGRASASRTATGAQVQQREHTGAGHREQRHSLGETVDGVAPLWFNSSRMAEMSVRVADSIPIRSW